jgi:hypothetical protein
MPTFMVGFKADSFGRILSLTAAGGSRKGDQPLVEFRHRTVSLGRQTA